MHAKGCPGQHQGPLEAAQAALARQAEQRRASKLGPGRAAYSFAPASASQAQLVALAACQRQLWDPLAAAWALRAEQAEQRRAPWPGAGPHACLLAPSPAA